MKRVSTQEKPKELLTVAEQVARLPPLSTLLGTGSASGHDRAKSTNATDKKGLKKEAKSTANPQKKASSCAEKTALTLTEMEAAQSNGSIAEVPMEVWNAIKQSLETPLVYRTDEAIATTLNILRRVPFLCTLTEDELLSVVEQMQLCTTKLDEVLLEKALPELDSVAEDAKFAVALSSDDEDNPMSDLNTKLDRMEKSKEAAAAKADPLVTIAGAPEEPRPVLVLVHGKVLAELPSANGKVHFPVLPGDTIGYDLQWNALPPGSRFVVTEQCTYLRLDLEGARLVKTLQRACDLCLQKQVNFLQNFLSAKLFDEMAEEEINRLAAQLLPLRLRLNQMIMEEGAAAEDLFFLAEGVLAVIRKVRPKDLCKKPTGATAGPRRSDSPPQVLERLPREMEVTRLHTGDIVGEMALLGHCPDVRPGEGAQWSAEYWRAQLETRFNTPGMMGTGDLDNSQKIFVEALAHKNEDDGNTTTMMMKEAKEALEAMQYPKEPLPRAATVYAKSPCLVYRLSYEAARACIRGVSYTKLSEYVKGYPSYDDLFHEFDRQQQWQMYRTEIAEEVHENNPHRRTKEKLPDFKF